MEVEIEVEVGVEKGRSCIRSSRAALGQWGLECYHCNALLESFTRGWDSPCLYLQEPVYYLLVVVRVTESVIYIYICICLSEVLSVDFYQMVIPCLLYVYDLVGS